ncbi:SDR family oxidoreductase [Endozoicomonas sp. SM1973]|uniref:Peroxisomal trans-2-enoyl-CoA reductase n=1 Tax=Spartinivicinus marinus TaxID=2994442 RepID=A0A853IGH8_9GAMM|nr:SDR family oxidoreductase [Spartinivicinus marinus]MCX4028678.1 SDR family oxidoreductase [Spartinivicinus marinus]NYZ69091.1 SDR family oxidoreductase [Spartinivicinus marinus]
MSYQSVFRPDLFQNKTMVVTGGGSGIGRCTAHELAALGATVVLIGRNEDKLTKTVDEIQTDGGTAHYFCCDIRQETSVKETVESIIKQHAVIDGLVNNAGGQFPAPLSQISQKGFETVVRTNLVGGFLMAREVFTQSMAKKGGAIVNIVADMWKGMPIMGHSGAARAGMVNLTKTAAVEWAGSGVRVNGVAPGWIASSGFDHYDSNFKSLLPKLSQAVPLQRFGTESEVSAAIVFLLSDAAAFINGETIQVDGAAPLSTVMWPMSPHQRSQPYNGFHRGKLPKVLMAQDETE